MKRASGRKDGWIPDIPDRRDKLFRRAVLHQQKSKSGNGKKEANAAGSRRTSSRNKNNQDDRTEPNRTFHGWEKSQMSLRKKLKSWKDKGVKSVEERYLDAMGRAFPEKYQPKKGPAKGPREMLILDGPPKATSTELPTAVDLRPFMSPIENQGDVGSCTAQAMIGLVEYLQIATRLEYVDASRSFLYKATRNFLSWEGDTGAYIRSTVKALRLFGTCPETHWPYIEEDFDVEPTAFCYSFAANYKALSYYRLEDLKEVQRSLAQGYPVTFGFTCYESMDRDEVSDSGVIPYPEPFERTDGGHAVLAVGYLDIRRGGRNSLPDLGFPDLVKDELLKSREDGFLIIRNSWGTDWGDAGYGYLPYRYIPRAQEDDDPSLSEDFWTMTQTDIPDLSDTSAPPFLVEKPGSGHQRS